MQNVVKASKQRPNGCFSTYFRGPGTAGLCHMRKFHKALHLEQFPYCSPMACFQRASNPHKCLHTHLFLYKHVFTYLQMHVIHMLMCLCICIHVFVYRHVYICIYIYVCTHTISVYVYIPTHTACSFCTVGTLSCSSWVRYSSSDGVDVDDVLVRGAVTGSGVFLLDSEP